MTFPNIKFKHCSEVLIPLLFCSIFITNVSCDKTQSGKEIKLAHGLDTNHPVHKGMVYMADRVKEISKGKMTIKIFSNGQLGAERELVELLQIGLIGITKVSAAVLENFVPDAKDRF